MTVDTATMRDCAAMPYIGQLHDALRLLRAAADELDRLNGLLSNAEWAQSSMRGSYDEERAAHAETKRELEEMRKLRRVDEALRDATRARLESAERVLHDIVSMIGSSEDSPVVRQVVAHFARFGGGT